jgi:hypothetical protein
MSGLLRRAINLVGLAILFALWMCQRAFAQELEPRRWTHLPTGQNIVAGGYGTTKAEIAFDPALRIENAVAEIDTWSAGYIGTFELLERSARVEVRQGWQSGRWSGLIDGVQTTVEREGWTDTVARFAVNLVGAPPFSGKAFADYRAATEIETIVGAAVVVHLPTGEYMKDRLINLGSNRFTFRSQLGAVHNRHDWSFELTGAAWVFTDNDSLFNGNRLEQEPIYTAQAHVVYTFRPGYWAAAGVGLGVGGQTTINGESKNDRRENLVWSVSAGVPLARQLGVKVGYIDSRRRTAAGSDSQTLAVGFVSSW